MPAEIRTARRPDLEALVAIENSAFSTDRISPRSFRRMLAVETAAMLVAECGDAILGYCLVLFRRGSGAARLYSIATGPASEGSGAGRILLAAAEQTARRRNCTRLRLEVRADNVRARQLYEKNGYRKVGTSPGYYADGEMAHHYEKDLSSRCEDFSASERS